MTPPTIALLVAKLTANTGHARRRTRHVDQYSRLTAKAGTEKPIQRSSGAPCETKSGPNGLRTRPGRSEQKPTAKITNSETTLNERRIVAFAFSGLATASRPMEIKI